MWDRRSRVTGSTVWYSSSIPSVKVGMLIAPSGYKNWPCVDDRPVEALTVYQREAANQRGFFASFWAIRALTIFLSNGAGKGFSSGKWRVPFAAQKGLSSSLNCSMAEEPSGKRLQ